MEDLVNDDNNCQYSDEEEIEEECTGKIPVVVMDQHHDAYKIIKRYVNKKNVLSKTGNTIIHFDAHVDDLIPDEIQIRTRLEAKSIRFRLFGDFGKENWLKEAVNDNVLKHVVWIKPPWALQTEDAHIELNENVTLDIKTLGRSVFSGISEDYEGFKQIFSALSPGDSYILDFEYNFFSSDSPFCEEYVDAPDYYSKLKELFKLEIPEEKTEIQIENASNKRHAKLEVLYEIFMYLQQHRTLPLDVKEADKELFTQILEFKNHLQQYYSEKNINWKNIYEAGLVSNDYILPVHHTTPEDIKKLLDCVSKLLDLLPNPPSLITISIMYEYDRYTPKNTLDFLQDALHDFFSSKYENVDFEYLDY